MSDLSGILIGIAAIITAVGGFIAVILKLNTIHTTFNSKMDTLLRLTADASYAAGVKDEKENKT